MLRRFDALMQRRSVETSHQNLAAEVERQLAAQSVATPAQQIVREYLSQARTCRARVRANPVRPRPNLLGRVPHPLSHLHGVRPLRKEVPTGVD